MALSDFFRINLPYGLQRNEDGSCYHFNREYVPIGFSERIFAFKLNKNDKFPELPIDVQYTGFDTHLLNDLLKFKGTAVHLNPDGSIDKIFLYNDATNPKSNPNLWSSYWNKLELLCNLKVNNMRPTLIKVFDD